MMYAKDLMIGDWVCTEHDSTPRQVDWIRAGEIGLLWNKIVTSPYLVPIPLTDEILKKNFPEPTDGITWFPQEGGFNCHSYVPHCEINAFGLFKYVHQLQHAIRLCGIKKEITL